MRHAFTLGGINFFDNAECYGDGDAERMMGAAVRRGIADGVWTREDLVLTTKIFMGTTRGPNAHGLSRKHILEGVRASLQRMALEYVDIVYCHRSDPHTPIEETVRAMNNVIEKGWAFYWGTSEWSSNDIIHACEIADRLGLIRPVVEQPQYNLFERRRVDFDFEQQLYRKYNTGLTTFSPLAYSVLTGKYANEIPSDSRLAQPQYTAFVPDFHALVQQTEKLRPIAEQLLGCTLAQLSLAWCASNPRVSSVIMGASSIQQLDENLQALDVIDKITPAIRQQIEMAVAFVPALRDQYFV